MKKIISAEQTRAADLYTIQNEPIDSIDLMERASLAFAKEFMTLYPPQLKVYVASGMGNNGGDGLAVARILSDEGYKVQIGLIHFSETMSRDCQINFDRISDQRVMTINALQDLKVSECDVIIDAIFGSGLNRPVKGLVGDCIGRINISDKPVVSIDVPSGLMSDELSSGGQIIESLWTLTFQRPKLAFMLPETGGYANNWKVLPIGLNEGFIENQSSYYYYQSLENLGALLPKRKKFQHKGDFGRVQVFAGSLGKIGAAFLCGKAVLRTGAGLLTMHIPYFANTIIQTSLPEAMVTLDSATDCISEGEIADHTNSICIGPGIGQDESTRNWLSQVLRNARVPVVLDADALNLISTMDKGYQNIPSGAVITPHVGEFKRLFPEPKDSLERISKMRDVAMEKQIVIVLKGAHTAIAMPDGKVVFNTTGNAGMATAGSGDVLSGIITGLLAQGLSAGDAARAGVMLHGLAGDMAEKKLGKLSLMASDLLNELPNAFINV